METKNNIKKTVTCLINNKPQYTATLELLFRLKRAKRHLYNKSQVALESPKVIGCLDYGIFKKAWIEKFKDKQSEIKFFIELEKLGIYHFPSEDLIILEPKEMQIKRKMIDEFSDFKEMFKFEDKVLKYLNEIQKEEDSDLFKKVLVLLLRTKKFGVDVYETSFLRTSKEELQEILSRFVVKYGLAVYNNGKYELSSFVNRLALGNFLCPYSGTGLMKFINELPKEEFAVFNILFKDQEKWGNLSHKVQLIKEEIAKMVDEKGEDSKEVKKLKAEENIINEEMKKIEEKSRKELGTSAVSRFFTHADKMAEILKISKERCEKIVLSLKIKGLFSTPKYSSQGLDWVEIPQNVINKLF